MLYDRAFVDGLSEGLTGVVGEWGFGPGTRIALMTLSENATFLATAPDGRQGVFRAHRPGYHRQDEIASELDWIAALRAEGTVDIPAILIRQDGGRIGSFRHVTASGEEIRHVVGFAFMSGAEPDPAADLTESFRRLGAISARLHDHARRWTTPAGFRRKTWDWPAAFGSQPLWGDWRGALGLDAEGRAVLERLADALRVRLEEYGTGPDRFGLVHADLRLANLLVEGDRIGVIDFDDCGFSWFVYDFAAAVSFIETHPSVPGLAAAWVDGYRGVSPLPEAYAAMIPAFVMFRRLLLTAWIATHAETETARWAGLDRYTAGTVALATRWLAAPERLPGLT